jgi:LysM repeat protein
MSKLDFGPTSPLLPRFGTNLNPFAPQSPQQVTPPLLPAQPDSPAAKDNLLVGSHVSTPGSATASFSLEPEEPQFVLHKVKRGENLGDLAKKYLGNRNLHMEIYNANRDDLMNPNDLRIGMTLKIPVPAAPAQPEKPVSPAPVKPEAPVAPTTPPETPAYSEYTVKRGESLSSIALDTLGDSERYMEIYNANRDIMKNPDALHKGMVLKIPHKNGATPPPKPDKDNSPAPVDAPSETGAVDATGLTTGAQELLAAMQRYQKHHRELGNTGRTKTTPAQMREIAKELDAASKAFGVDPKMMLALYAHESGGINPSARSHTGAGGLGQMTSIAIRQVHFMAGIGKGNRGTAPYTEHKDNFIQSTRSINQRYNIKANVWSSVAYMSYELNDRARLGRGVEKALKRYGDPHVPTYANKVNAEYRTLFGGKLF